MSSMAAVQALREAGRKVFGPDYNLLLARSPEWGHEDACVLVYGQHHHAAARAFLQIVPDAQIAEETSCAWRGRPAYTYSVVTFNPIKEQAA